MRSHGPILTSLAVVAAIGLGGCVRGPAMAPPAMALTSVTLPEGAPRAPLAWADFTPATFAKAKAERKFIVLDGSAEWCHWCHVMEATTYHDEAVAALLASRFIAVKVDVDSRPDIEERYADWGWPATVIFSPDAEEIGKYRGYIAPRDFAGILRDVIASGESGNHDDKVALTPLVRGAARLSDEQLAYLERDTELDLDEYYDEDEGGWGRTQKVPIGGDNAWALARAASGDRVMRARVVFTLGKQAGVIDPVWGGVYQYSIGHDWTHPHFEKLMPFQAGALENYANAYALTGNASFLATAASVRRYMDAFLVSPQGGFYASQDADVNAHDTTKPFVSGHDYYALPDLERRARGTPRVDTHEYAHENGLAIAAYVTLYDATCAAHACDTAALGTAQRAAARVLATHLVVKAGSPAGVAHDADKVAHVLHLGDNAAFGFALVRLFEATHDTSYRDQAESLVPLLTSLTDPDTGAFLGSTADPDAVGVFSRRRVPFEENVMAIRFLTKLSHVGREESRAAYAALAEKALAGVARPEAIRAQGRMIGEFLLALDEVRQSRQATATR